MAGIKADDILDRQRLRRKLSFWRIAALVIAVIGIGLLATLSRDDADWAPKRDQVAKFHIEGTITEDEKVLTVLDEMREADHVKGVILVIDSPGGTTTGGEAIYDAVRKLAAEKPVTAQVGTLAASAGYMIAAGTDHIVARQTSIVGSIGVLFQYPNFETLLTNLGIDMRSIKSSPLKAEPSFFGVTPPGAEDMIRRMILDSYDWFKDLVAERRNFSRQQIEALADGSIFTGRQALENGLVDALGGEDASRAWLTGKGVDADLDTIVWKTKSETPGLGTWVRAAIAREFGFADPLSSRLYDRLMLDGLLSVWHGQTSSQESQR